MLKFSISLNETRMKGSGGEAFLFLTRFTLKSLRVVFTSTQLCCLLNLHKQLSMLLLETQTRPHQSKLPRAHPRTLRIAWRNITQMPLVPAVDLSPEVLRDRMLFARYFNINSNSFKKNLFSTKKATTKQTF